VRVTLVLMENKLWEFSNTKVAPSTYPKDLVDHELKDVKSKRIILYVVKDHLISHIFEKNSSREMLVSMANIFQSRNTNRNMVLRENPRDTKMTK
jgi:hypothetical protein